MVGYPKDVPLPCPALPVMSFSSSHIFLGSLAWPHQMGPTRDDGLLHKGCFTPQPHLFSCGVASNHGGLDWQESAETSIRISRPPSHSGAGRLFFSSSFPHLADRPRLKKSQSSATTLGYGLEKRLAITGKAGPD